MAVTGTSALSNSVQALYLADYMMQTGKTQCWSQFAWWKSALGGQNLRGSSVNFPIYNRLEPATTAISETADVTPVAMADQNIQVTFAEYGNVVQRTQLLDVESYVEIGKPAAAAVAINLSETRDKLIRAAAIGGTWVYRPNDNTARTGLDTTNDKVTLARLYEMVAICRNQAMPNFNDGNLVALIHPGLLVDLLADTSIAAILQYSDPKIAYNYEIAKIAGIRILSHEYGKVYLSGGTVAQAATTTTADVAAGATTVPVTSATGLAAGNWITLGTLEAADAEQVQITAVATLDLTVKGIGNTDGNFGCHYAHLSGAAVTEAANVYGMVLFGPQSLPSVYASELGKDGRISVDWAATNIPKRFLNHSWNAIWGFGKVQKHLLRGEFAGTNPILGWN